MTCEDMREQLLTGDTFDIAHLERCPKCAELAARIRATEDDLRDWVDAFSVPTDLDAQWERAVRTAGPQRRWSLHALLVLVAAVAVVLLLVVPRMSERPAVAPPALVEAVELVDHFDTLPLDGFDLEGLDRQAQDQLLNGALKDKAAALSEAEAALAPLLEEGEPRWRVEAARELGDLYARMGDALYDMQRPAYLKPKQLELYGMGLEDKAWAQWQKALDTWALGAEIAREHGLDEEAAELETLAEVERVRREVAAMLDACAEGLSPESVAEVREVLATEQDLDVLQAYADGLEEACAE